MYKENKKGDKNEKRKCRLRRTLRQYTTKHMKDSQILNRMKAWKMMLK